MERLGIFDVPGLVRFRSVIVSSPPIGNAASSGIQLALSQEIPDCGQRGVSH